MSLVTAVLDDAAAAEEGRVHVVREAEGRAEVGEGRPRAGGRQNLARQEKKKENQRSEGDEGIRRWRAVAA